MRKFEYSHALCGTNKYIDLSLRYNIVLQVCQKAFEAIYHVSHHTLLDLVNKAKASKPIEHKRAKKESFKVTKEDTVKVWMTTFFEQQADLMPFSNAKYGRLEQHLPTWMTQQLVFNEFLKQMAKVEGMRLKFMFYVLCLGKLSILYVCITGNALRKALSRVVNYIILLTNELCTGYKVSHYW